MPPEPKVRSSGLDEGTQRSSSISSRGREVKRRDRPGFADRFLRDAKNHMVTNLHRGAVCDIMAMAAGAQTERRGIPRPVRLPRGGEDAPAAFVSSCPLFARSSGPVA